MIINQLAWHHALLADMHLQAVRKRIRQDAADSVHIQSESANFSAPSRGPRKCYGVAEACCTSGNLRRSEAGKSMRNEGHSIGIAGTALQLALRRVMEP